MTNRTRFCVGVLFILGALTPATLAQTGGAVRNPSAASSSDAPFDASQERLPRNYAPTIGRQLFHRLHEAIPRRGEFETSDEYRARFVESARRLRVGQDLYAISSRGYRGLTYDADAAAWHVYSLKDLELRPDEHRTTSTYAARTLFGVPVMVTRQTGYAYDFVVHFPRERRLEDEMSPDLWFPMARETARSVKDDLALLFVVTVCDDEGSATPDPEARAIYTSVIERGHEPTATEPRDITIRHYQAHVLLRELWLYSIRTGEVFGKRRVAADEPLADREGRSTAEGWSGGIRIDFNAEEDAAAAGGSGSRDASKPVPVSDGFLAARATRRPRPAASKLAGLSGVVVVELVVSRGGKVVSANALSGIEQLRQAAVDVARDWEFEPVILDGSAVEVTGTVTIEFGADTPPVRP